MEVILLERVAKLGQMGEIVTRQGRVRPQFPAAAGQGAARHRGQPQRKFEGESAQLEARNLERKGEARPSPKSSTARASSSCARPARPASSTARCRRATSPRRHRNRRLRRIAQPGRAQPRRSRRSGFTRCRSRCTRRSRSPITINVARSADEAERLARGEDVISRRDEERAEQAAAVEAEAFFEKPEAVEDAPAEQPAPEQEIAPARLPGGPHHYRVAAAGSGLAGTGVAAASGAGGGIAFDPPARRELQGLQALPARLPLARPRPAAPRCRCGGGLGPKRASSTSAAASRGPAPDAA